MKRPECICFGSIILDYRRRVEKSPGREKRSLQLVRGTGSFKIGGISILSIALKRMGCSIAVVGLVGRDIPGYGIKAYLKEKYEINTEAIRFIDYSTSHSFIKLTDDERYIQHDIGANRFLKPDVSNISFIRKRKPALVAIGYSGLLPLLDRDKGAAMAEFIAALKSDGIKTALDTHTLSKNYSALVKPLKIADIFFCNAEEGRHISGENKPENMLNHIVDRFGKDDDSFRVAGITLPNGVYIAYGKKDRFHAGFVESRWHTNQPRDLTGAGDAFRAGFYMYLMNNMKSFDVGNFDWQKAGRLGNYTAAVMVKNGFSGIKNYKTMFKRSTP